MTTPETLDAVIAEQKATALAILNEKILDLFPVQIDGYPSTRSQYGIDYLSIANGVVRAEGTPSRKKELPRAIIDCMTWFEQQKARGHDLLVWRSKPELGEDRDGHYRLYMRCHTMKAGEATSRLAAANPTGIHASRAPFT